MKKTIIVSALILSGCGSFDSQGGYGSNLLDTAPRNDYEVKHPEWGDPPYTVITVQRQVTSTTVEHNQSSSLEQFLRQNGIEYRLIPGEFAVIQLEPVIQFATDSAQINPQSRQWLDRLARHLATTPEIEVVIDGHTDNVGLSRYNDQLAQKRAESVEQALVSQRVTRQSIYTRAFGETMPKCSNTSSAGKQCNRRVEIKFIYPAG
ncbi:OmpA family protein [Vibrio sp. WXL103]|uniref:OmpA family protein n=1 Tax=unclassified Vibrio TaxID=2614977 RepID=UPI0030E111D5